MSKSNQADLQVVSIQQLVRRAVEVADEAVARHTGDAEAHHHEASALDQQEERRLLRASEGRVTARETKRRKREERASAQVHADDETQADVAALRAALLQRADAPAQVASALRRIGCTTGRARGSAVALDPNGLPDRDLAEAVASDTELPLPVRSWSYLGAVLRMDSRVLCAMRVL